MRVFLDMDGVLADYDKLVLNFSAYQASLGLPRVTADQMATHPGVFLNLEPMPGALDAVPAILAMGFDVYIASKPAPSHPMTYHDKADWVIRTFPLLKKKLILTQDKGLLGSPGDFLVDDRPHKANCVNFPGHILHFGGDAPATPVRQERITWVPDWTVALRALSFLMG